MIKKEKIKEWLNEKKEKGVKWYADNRETIYFVAGWSAGMVGILLSRKLFEPKEGVIEYVPHSEEDLDARIFVRDRFGIETNMLNVRYKKSNSDLLLEMSDTIGKFCDSEN